MAEPLIDDAFIERLKSRDERWKELDTAIKLDEELRSSMALNLVLEAAAQQAQQAKDQLVTVNPADTQAIIALQAKAYRAIFIAETLEAVRQRGIMAHRSLEDDGPVEG